MDVETVTLRARAADAYEAAQLETVADDERARAAHVERMVAAAVAAVEYLYGPDALEGEPERMADGAVTVTVAGARLVIDPHFPRAPRGMVACPLCRRPDCRTVTVINSLERLGQLIVAPGTLQLDPHPADDDECDGLTRVARPDPPPVYRALFALNRERVENACNDLDAAGYRITVVAGRDSGWLVLGHAPRRHPPEPDDPF